MTTAEMILAALAVILIGFSKAGFGGGTGILATPLMVIALGPKPALGIMLPLLILCDWGTCVIHHRHWQWKPVRQLLPACIVGIGLGFLLLDHMNGLWLKRFLGILCIGFCLLQWLPSHQNQTLHRYWNHLKGHTLGGLTGISSTLAHAAGPVVTMYLLPLQLAPRTFVATSVLAFTLINLIKLPGYLMLELIETQSLLTSLKLAIFLPIGIALGLFALNHLNPSHFKRIIYILVFLTGLDLISGKSLLQLLLS